MNNYNVWNKWDKLETVMLGSHYVSDFFNDIKNSRIRSALQRIADETQEDLLHYESVLKDFGCEVIRPNLDTSDSIMNYINKQGEVAGTQGVPRSPLQPRDCQFVAGNKLFVTIREESILKRLQQYNNQDIVYLEFLSSYNDHVKLRHWNEDRFNTLKGECWGTFDEYKNNPKYFDELPDSVCQEILSFHEEVDLLDIRIDAPSYTTVGKDLYIDTGDATLFDFQQKKLLDNIPNARINKLHHGGHSDGCFHTLKPGAILSLKEIQRYKDTFPGWDVCYLPDQSWDKVDGFEKLKGQVGGKWWVPGQEDNDEFTHFVETWLHDWVGYVEETVFDVNVLVLDEHHVCVNNMNPTVIEFLKKHNMEPVHVPWRHRYFWDGGLHCITLDLKRQGTQQDYFPERSNSGVIDYGFD